MTLPHSGLARAALFRLRLRELHEAEDEDTMHDGRWYHRSSAGYLQYHVIINVIVVIILVVVLVVVDVFPMSRCRLAPSAP